MVADGIHADLGFGYAVTTPAFALITAAIFLWWYRSEGTLSIHTIDTPRRERFYWAAVLGTFALGTAAGDFTATTLNLGFLDSILLFAGVIAIPAIGWWRFNMNPIFAFWFAYVITRPLGASFSDWFSKPPSITGLGLGNGTVSWIGLVVFIPIVAWVAITKLDIQPGHGPHPHAHHDGPPAARPACASARARGRVAATIGGLMSARPDEALTRWLLRQTARAAEFAAAHETIVDVAVAVLIAATSFVGLAIQGRLSHPGTIVFCILLCAPLTVRGRSRSLCFALVAGVALAQWLTSTPQIADAAVLVALYWLALDGPLIAIIAAAVVTEAAAVMAAARWSPTDVVKYWVGLTALGVASAVLGVSIRQRRALLASLEERAARLEFERDQEGRLGAAAERARIAREMHDIVSHNLTVMIGLADGATYALQTAPEAAGSAMQRVSATGRQALGEMRRLLGVLRDDPAAEPFAASARTGPARRTARSGRGGRRAGLDRDRGRSARALRRRATGGVPGRTGGADERAQARQTAGHRPAGVADRRRTRRADRHQHGARGGRPGCRWPGAARDA